MGITVMFLLILAVIFSLVFFSSPKEVSPVLVFNKPKVNIDMKVFDSGQFKDLQPLAEMQPQYSYKATTKDNRAKTGFISAASIDQATIILEGDGLIVSEIKEITNGRDDPFAPYYQPVASPVPIK